MKKKLTPETAREANRLLLARRAVEKLKTGQPLSDRELAAVEAEETPPDADADALDSKDWPGRANSIAEAARVTGLARSTLHSYRKENPKPFRPNGTVNLAELRAWMAKTGKRGGETPSLERARLAVLTETARKLKTQNDVKSGTLIESSAVISSFAKIAAELNALRLQSEEQAPIALAGAGGDIPRTREVFRGTWNEIMRCIGGLARHWESHAHATQKT